MIKQEIIYQDNKKYCRVYLNQDQNHDDADLSKLKKIYSAQGVYDLERDCVLIPLPENVTFATPSEGLLDLMKNAGDAVRAFSPYIFPPDSIVDITNGTQFTKGLSYGIGAFAIQQYNNMLALGNTRFGKAYLEEKHAIFKLANQNYGEEGNCALIFPAFGLDDDTEVLFPEDIERYKMTVDFQPANLKKMTIPPMPESGFGKLGYILGESAPYVALSLFCKTSVGVSAVCAVGNFLQTDGSLSHRLGVVMLGLPISAAAHPFFHKFVPHGTLKYAKDLGREVFAHAATDILTHQGAHHLSEVTEHMASLLRNPFSKEEDREAIDASGQADTILSTLEGRDTAQGNEDIFPHDATLPFTGHAADEGEDQVASEEDDGKTRTNNYTSITPIRPTARPEEPDSSNIHLGFKITGGASLAVMVSVTAPLSWPVLLTGGLLMGATKLIVDKISSNDHAKFAEALRQTDVAYQEAADEFNRILEDYQTLTDLTGDALESVLQKISEDSQKLTRWIESDKVPKLQSRNNKNISDDKAKPYFDGYAAMIENLQPMKKSAEINLLDNPEVLKAQLNHTDASDPCYPLLQERLQILTLNAAKTAYKEKNWDSVIANAKMVLAQDSRCQDAAFLIYGSALATNTVDTEVVPLFKNLLDHGSTNFVLVQLLWEYYNLSGEYEKAQALLYTTAPRFKDDTDTAAELTALTQRTQRARIARFTLTDLEQTHLVSDLVFDGLTMLCWAREKKNDSKKDNDPKKPSLLPVLRKIISHSLTLEAEDHKQTLQLAPPSSSNVAERIYLGARLLSSLAELPNCFKHYCSERGKAALTTIDDIKRDWVSPAINVYPLLRSTVQLPSSLDVSFMMHYPVELIIHLSVVQRFFFNRSELAESNYGLLYVGHLLEHMQKFPLAELTKYITVHGKTIVNWLGESSIKYLVPVVSYVSKKSVFLTVNAIVRGMTMLYALIKAKEVADLTFVAQQITFAFELLQTGNFDDRLTAGRVFKATKEQLLQHKQTYGTGKANEVYSLYCLSLSCEYYCFNKFQSLVVEQDQDSLYRAIALYVTQDWSSLKCQTVADRAIHSHVSGQEFENMQKQALVAPQLDTLRALERVLKRTIIVVVNQFEFYVRSDAPVGDPVFVRYHRDTQRYDGILIGENYFLLKQFAKIMGFLAKQTMKLTINTTCLLAHLVLQSPRLFKSAIEAVERQDNPAFTLQLSGDAAAQSQQIIEHLENPPPLSLAATIAENRRREQRVATLEATLTPMLRQHSPIYGQSTTSTPGDDHTPAQESRYTLLH